MPEATARDLYRAMVRARVFELAIADLWRDGLISGEMHLGTGEEAVVAGVLAHLGPDDALALDHRPTPPLLLAGVDPVAILRELLGREDGLCGGRGGHMHLFSTEPLAASSGIVGASGPLAVGLGLALSRRSKRAVAVAFFGDGAVNQGQLMESLNLAVAWKLPVLFVCKDNGLAITTASDGLTGGGIEARARGFGLEYDRVDGLDAGDVSQVAERALDGLRRGATAHFLHAVCSRLDGHLLGDEVIQLAEHPLEGDTLGRTVASALRLGGGGVAARTRSMTRMLGLLASVRKDRRDSRRDPLVRGRRGVTDADAIDREAAEEVTEIVARSLEGVETPAEVRS